MRLARGLVLLGTLGVVGCDFQEREATTPTLGHRSSLDESATAEKPHRSARSLAGTPSVSRAVEARDIDASEPRTARPLDDTSVAFDTASPAAPATAIRLTDVTSQTGITFRHTDGGSGKGYIAEGVASGLVIFDYDQDGFEDIYFLNGAPLRGTAADDQPRNALYRNHGDWTFSDTTATAGVGDTGFALGGTAGDYDNDGDLDLYVANFGPNVLYRNNGDGTFTVVTADAKVSAGERFGAGASFFDMERDGDLDLYVANYVDFRYDNHVEIVREGHRLKAGPQYYDPVPDTLYRNDGDGTFTDVSEESGIGKVAGPGMATLCWDFNDDGHEDVYVCNDGEPNFLFLNDGTGRFEEAAVLAGLAYDFHGKANSSMGVDCGDYDGDGKLDLFVTGYQSEMPVLYHNLGNGLYEDASSSAKIEGDLFAHVHWGTAFADFDNDADQDLFVACGHFDPIELIDDRTAKKVRNYLLMNRGDGTFADVSEQCGSGMAVVESSRGAAFDDLDNDGDIDAVILNSDTLPTVLRNDTATENHWLQVRLRQSEKNRFAIGARVRVVTKERSQIGVAISGRGYQSYFGTRLHFGLGASDSVEFVEVRWPNGKLERFTVDTVDRIVEVTAGTGETQP